MATIGERRSFRWENNDWHGTSPNEIHSGAEDGELMPLLAIALAVEDLFHLEN